ncbi:hypothetical protein D9M71_735020 [compost metagenome]
MIEIRRNPDSPLGRREETALGGVHPEHTTDGIGKLHPVVSMGRRPRPGIEALHPGVQRTWQCDERWNAAFEGNLSVSRH